MKTIRRGILGFIQLLVVLTLLLGIAGCSLFTVSSKPEPLPAVSSLPLPSLPDWIEEISPTGETETLAQIRIRFKNPLIPLENLDSDSQQELLEKFEVIPPLAGHFRFLTPRMVGFQADEALPKATRMRVTLKSGLGDLENHVLKEDLAWTFSTSRIQLTDLPKSRPSPEAEIEPIDIQPTLKFTSNVALDLDSLRKHLRLIPQGEKESVALRVKEEETPPSNASPQETFNPTEKKWTYLLTPRNPLDKGKTYELEITKGLHPLVGNLASEFPFKSEVKTYDGFQYQELTYFGEPNAGGTYGRFSKGYAQLTFNNAIAPNSIEHITIQPNPKERVQAIQAYEGSNIININPWALEPDTTYKITLGSKLEDKFGQKLGKTVSITYNTGDLAGDIWAPTGLNIFPSNQDLQLNISAVNLPQSQYQAKFAKVNPTALIYRESAYSDGGNKDLLPATLPWETVSVSSQKNKSVEVTVPIKEKLGSDTGMLAYVVKAKTNRYPENGEQKWSEPSYYGLVQLTNLGVFAQWFPESGLIRVNHLSDGSAVENAEIEIYRSRLYNSEVTRADSVPCTTATTDKTGIAILPFEKWKSCYSTASDGPELLVIAKEKSDWAFTRTFAYSGAYDYGLEAEWDTGKPLSRGIIFSDRKLYQPSETAWFTTTAYYLDKGQLKQDKNLPYSVTLQSPNGKETKLGTYTTNEFGTFSLELPLEKTQPLGYYTLVAKNDSGVEISGEFRVAEFNPPNFQVNLELNQEVAFPGDTVEATASSQYLFGSPVKGGKTKYYVTRYPLEITPNAWEEFTFGRQWFWPEEKPTVSSDVLESYSVSDEAGNSSQRIEMSKEIPFAMTYRVDAEVSDVSNLSVSNSKTLTVLPNNRLIGLKSDWVATAGEAFPVEVIVTDATGNPLDGQRIHLELQSMDYSSVTQVIEGSQTPKNQVEYKTVDEVNLRSQSKPISVFLTPPESGSYRIRANFRNSRNENTATDTQIWVTGSTLTYWGDRYQNNRLDIQLDKESYQVGDTATALIQSPYPEAELYFAIIRHDTIDSQLTKVTGNAPKIQFTVTPEMLPNAAVEAVLVRQGQPLAETRPGSIDKLAKVGFVPFSTNLSNQYLTLDITPQQTQTQPGNSQTLQLQLTNRDKQPISGQVTLMVVNEAVLQLSGYRPPDLVKTVYASQPITTRFSDNRPDVVLQNLASPIDKGWGYGGGLSAGGESTRIRTNFKPIAYYNGSVLTDSNGKATVSFSLPDDLTTWRVMGVATDGNLHFGNAETTFITTQPLLTNPVLPQFARVGDRIEGGLSVTNNTGKTGKLRIQGIANGSLKFAESSHLTTKATSTTQAYRFPLIAETPGNATIQFTTQLNRHSDAFNIPLEVKPLEVTEQVISTGVTDTQVTIPIEKDNTVNPNVGGLEISLASTLLPEITVPAEQVLSEDSLPFLESSASNLIIAANLQQLSQQYGVASSLNLETLFDTSIENLQKLQKPDGGFSTWPGQDFSNPILTPYAANAIAQATQAGFSIDATIVSRLKTYLNNILANPTQSNYCNTQLCKNEIRFHALVALSNLGDTRRDFLSDIYSQHTQLNPATQIQLTRYLSQFPEWQSESATLYNEIQEILYKTGRSATLNYPAKWHWISSPTPTQAEALQLYISKNASPEITNRIFQGLLNLRRDETWPTRYDTAAALTALVKYAQLQPPPSNYRATVSLNQKQLAAPSFKGIQNPSLELTVPMQQLPQGKNDLILKKDGQGRLHYITAYRYRLEGNQPGRLNGLRITRQIRPANQPNILQEYGLYAWDDPLTLPPGQVFDIGLEIICDHSVDSVVISDPLPAGLEPVDTSFQTTTAYFQPQQDSWEIDYQKIDSDRIVAYADHLEPGIYTLHYLIRSVTPGQFTWPGANVHLQYAPEEFGRSASAIVKISNP